MRLRTLPQSRALSSSFGAQSAAALHLITRQTPDIPVILVDTGYLFAETYRFADELAQLDERLAEARARAFERARMTPADARLRPIPAADAPLRMHPYKALRMGYELARGLRLL